MTADPACGACDGAGWYDDAADAVGPRPCPCRHLPPAARAARRAALDGVLADARALLAALAVGPGEFLDVELNAPAWVVTVATRGRLLNPVDAWAGRPVRVRYVDPPPRAGAPD